MTDFPNCIACGGKMVAWFDLPHSRVFRCQTPTCRLAITGFQPADKELQQLYANLYYGNDSCLPSGRYENSDTDKFEQHFEAIEKIMKLRGKRILDFGCGIGNFIKIAQINGASETIGVEFDDSARLIARERGMNVVRDLDKLAGQEFDFAYLNDVIEHLRDPIVTCRAIYKLLKPGGTIFICTPNPLGLKARLLGSRWEEFRNPTHFFFFTTSSASAILHKAGFTNAREMIFSVRFSHHGWFRSGIQRLLVATGLDSTIKMIANKPWKD